MFGMAVSDGYLDYNPFHDVKIPKVPGRRAIKIATLEQYLRVRACLPTKPAQVFSTLLVSSGIRFCEAIGLQPADFDFETGILEVARSVVKVSRQHHPQGKTFLVRDYTKNGHTRRLKLDGAVVEIVRGYLAEHGIGEAEVMFPAELVVPPRRTKAGLTEEQLQALQDHRRRSHHFARPLGRCRLDDERAAIELHARGVLERGTDRRPPREPDLAVRERRVAQQLDQGARDGMGKRTHGGTKILPCASFSLPHRRGARSCCAPPASPSTSSQPM